MMKYILTLLLLAACQAGQGSDAEVDAGADAPPAYFVEQECTDVSTDLMLNTYDYTAYTFTNWYADVSLPGLRKADAPSVVALICDPECFGFSCVPLCIDGYTCTHDGYTRPVITCFQQLVQVEDDRVVVFCGSKTEISYPLSTQNNYVAGQRYKKVYVKVLD